MIRLSLLALFVVACSTAPVATPGEPTPASTPTPAAEADEPPPPAQSPGAADPVAALIDKLEAAGATASEGDAFDAMPLGNQGQQVCVDGDSINVYVFPTAEQAQARASTIDPRDPSNVGTAIIEWVGNPKFWLHDRVIVLYSGTDQQVTDTLVNALGEPFAFGQGRPPLRGDDGC